MARRDKLLDRILTGTSDRNIPFLGLRNLLLRMGFHERVQGRHHMFERPGIEGMINLQREGHQAKGYQVRQVRKVILKHRLRMDE
jgi:hypothetical protein